MTTYLYIFCEIISLIFLKFSVSVDSKMTKKVFFILALLPFSTLFYIRGINVGTDYKAYSKVYLSIVDGTLTMAQKDWVGIGFIYICKFLSVFFERKYFLAYALINIITLFLIVKTIVDLSNYPTMSLFIFFSFCLHFQIFNQFRQMMAIAIVFWSYRYIKERDIKKFLITILIASIFHRTALILIPFYWIVEVPVNAKNIFIWITIAIILYFGFDKVMSLLMYTYYGRIYYGGRYDVVQASSKLNFIIRVIMLTISLLFYKKVKNKNPQDKYLYILVIICTLTQVTAMRSYIFARITTYFFIFYILLLPDVIAVIFKSKKSKILLYYVVILVLCLYQYVYYNSSSGASGGGYTVFSVRNTDISEL